ncbi:MAG: response regulator, partial [Thiolinea sp.]
SMATQLTQSARVLLVDDDSLNRFVGQKLLVVKGADARLAKNGSEAIHQLQEQPFDIVLMDLSLPGMDGYETTRQIRADDKISDCPIIALTAHTLGNEQQQCFRSGMNDYLTKPYKTDELVNMILKHHHTATTNIT